MNKPIKVIVMGGRRSQDFPQQNLDPDVEARAFLDVVASTRRAIDWQLEVQ
ncbi:hypothetical protein [Thauera sinica]|uniref:Uncharacterized protein n=1 Tax=Thauera sinica TaxID=2665146 RepID=A0ABW1AXT7_9RHOO|nr:hypothetical protein [Thauera sp. K11]